jgi:3-dehydroquinate synthase
LLNFGHTFAHAIERYFNFEKVLHGEAVWWGMHCAIACSKECGSLNGESKSDYDAIVNLMSKPSLPKKPDSKRLYEMMFTDKKVVDGKLRLVLPTVPGISVVRGDIPAATVKSVMTAVFG